MARDARHLISLGIGFSPGSVKFMPTLGLSMIKDPHHVTLTTGRYDPVVNTTGRYDPVVNIIGRSA